MRTLLQASALLVALFGSLAASPVHDAYHPFCKILWQFALPCDDIKAKLLHQIQAFSPVNGCEKCHYTIDSAIKNSIKAHRASPDNLHIESIEFGFHTTTLTGSCNVFAHSASIIFTGLLDGGRNYCNLHDLLISSGLNNAPGFIGITNSEFCLGSGTSPCDT